MIFEHLNR